MAECRGAIERLNAGGHPPQRGSQVKVSDLSTHAAILNNVEKIPLKQHEELTLSELCPGSLSQ